ncbi:hypothetical protein VIGAN_08070600 [Vigna angularis var. angularis]|uniref:Uncharacterized protein n=1 Tax=Vigna angularis var. angularis TaxID=157739 RepID=A0A0S3SMV9_PHAAN|nr:hypothetical protein VIGAN_08070600 [Vigna angularis var. angularis]
MILTFLTCLKRDQIMWQFHLVVVGRMNCYLLLSFLFNYVFSPLGFSPILCNPFTERMCHCLEWFLIYFFSHLASYSSTRIYFLFPCFFFLG